MADQRSMVKSYSVEAAERNGTPIAGIMEDDKANFVHLQETEVVAYGLVITDQVCKFLLSLKKAGLLQTFFLSGSSVAYDISLLTGGPNFKKNKPSDIDVYHMGPTKTLKQWKNIWATKADKSWSPYEIVEGGPAYSLKSGVGRRQVCHRICFVTLQPGLPCFDLGHVMSTLSESLPSSADLDPYRHVTSMFDIDICGGWFTVETKTYSIHRAAWRNMIVGLMEVTVRDGYNWDQVGKRIGKYLERGFNVETFKEGS